VSDIVTELIITAAGQREHMAAFHSSGVLRVILHDSISVVVVTAMQMSATPEAIGSIGSHQFILWARFRCQPMKPL
jgi:hypothetical protein